MKIIDWVVGVVLSVIPLLFGFLVLGGAFVHAGVGEGSPTAIAIAAVTCTPGIAMLYLALRRPRARSNPSTTSGVLVLAAFCSVCIPRAARSEIVPAASIAGVRLGMSDAEVRAFLGRPDRIEDEPVPPKVPALLWHDYTKRKLRVRMYGNLDPAKQKFCGSRPPRRRRRRRKGSA